MQGLIHWRLKITLSDGRALVGQMLAFDKHMNLVIVDCEEFRRVRSKKKSESGEPLPPQEMKRTLGLVIIRGEVVVRISVEGPPPVPDEDKAASTVSSDLFIQRRRADVLRSKLATSWPRSWYASWTRCKHDAPR